MVVRVSSCSYRFIPKVLPCLRLLNFLFYLRTRKGDTKPLAVRKYGVLTQRTDIEMLPLPLDDEDDDDTVFDVGNHAGGR